MRSSEPLHFFKTRKKVRLQVLTVDPTRPSEDEVNRSIVESENLALWLSMQQDYNPVLRGFSPNNRGPFTSERGVGAGVQVNKVDDKIQLGRVLRMTWPGM